MQLSELEQEPYESDILFRTAKEELTVASGSNYFWLNHCSQASERINGNRFIQQGQISLHDSSTYVTRLKEGTSISHFLTSNLSPRSLQCCIIHERIPGFLHFVLDNAGGRGYQNRHT